MRTLLPLCTGAALSLIALPASAAIINVSPADGTDAYTLIEGANPGDEVVIAPGTYAFRVYLQTAAPASQPIYIHAQDLANPPVWDPGTTLVDDLPGSYTAGDKARGCWQVSGGTNYTIEGIVFQNCHAADNDSAGLRYYNGTSGLLIEDCLFQSNDNGLTGGTEDSDAAVEFSEFAQNGNLAASAGSPTHNVYIYGGTFALRYSYLHDPLQAQNLHCRAVTSTVEYNWFDRALSYVGDLMTSDDYANNPVGSLLQTMTLRGNVIIQGPDQANDSQIFAVYNDEASGSPVSFSVTALYNTVIGAGGHAAFLHLSNADGTVMSAQVSNNVVSGTSQPILVEDTAEATVTGSDNWLQTGAPGAGLTGTVSGAAPGFTDASSDDFTLAAGSACIGAADTGVSGLPVAEYYENEIVTREYRVRATAKDLGAFEHTTEGPGIGPGGSAGGGSPDGGPLDDGGAGDAGTAGAGGGGSGGESAGSTSSTGSASSGGTGGSGTGGGGTASPQSSGGCKCGTVGGEVQPGALWGIALALGAMGRARNRRRQGR